MIACLTLAALLATLQVTFAVDLESQCTDPNDCTPCDIDWCSRTIGEDCLLNMHCLTGCCAKDSNQCVVTVAPCDLDNSNFIFTQFGWGTC